MRRRPHGRGQASLYDHARPAAPASLWPDLERRQRNRLEDAALQSDPGLNMSLSGLTNIGHDVGGFHGPSPGPELFCRFVEFCALWPRMVMNPGRPAAPSTRPGLHPTSCHKCAPSWISPQPAALSLLPDVARGGGRCAAGAPAVVGFCGGHDRRRKSRMPSCSVAISDSTRLDEGATTRSVYLPAPSRRAGTTGMTGRHSRWTDRHGSGTAGPAAAVRPRRRDQCRSKTKTG